MAVNRVPHFWYLSVRCVKAGVQISIRFIRCARTAPCFKYSAQALCTRKLASFNKSPVTFWRLVRQRRSSLTEMLFALDCSSCSSLTRFSHVGQRCYGAHPIVRSMNTSGFSRCPIRASRRPASTPQQVVRPLHKADVSTAAAGSANVDPASVDGSEASRLQRLLLRALGLFSLSGLLVTSLCILRLHPRSGAPFARIHSAGLASISSSSTHRDDTSATGSISQLPSSEDGSKAKGIESPRVQVGARMAGAHNRHTYGNKRNELHEPTALRLSRHVAFTHTPDVLFNLFLLLCLLC